MLNATLQRRHVQMHGCIQAFVAAAWSQTHAGKLLIQNRNLILLEVPMQGADMVLDLLHAFCAGDRNRTCNTCVSTTTRNVSAALGSQN